MCFCTIEDNRPTLRCANRIRNRPNLLPAPSGLTFRSHRACMCLLGLENDQFRLETQVSTTLQRNSGPDGTPCCCSDSSARSCCGSLTGNSRLCCSNCRHGSPGSSPLGSSTNNLCNTARRNRQLFTTRLFANAVSDTLQCLRIQLSEQIAFIISSVLSDDTKTNILAVTYTIRLPTSLSLWLVYERSTANSIKLSDSIES